MKLMFGCFQIRFLGWARVCFNCSLDFMHWNYFLMDTWNLVSLSLVFIFNVNLVESRMFEITFSI